VEGLVFKPRPVIEAPLRCWAVLGFEGVIAEGGEEETALVECARGLNISIKEDRRRCWGAGDGGVFWPDMLKEITRVERFNCTREDRSCISSRCRG